MNAVFHRNLKAGLRTATRGQGVYLYDSDGTQYIDASGGAAVSCLGHSNERVIQQVKRQLDKLAFAHTSFFTNEPAEKLASQLIALTPKGFGEGRVMFLGSGSEATEAALKLALQYQTELGQPQRSQFISRRMSYHGNSLGALAVGGHPQRQKIYQPALMHCHYVAPCYEYRDRAAGESDAGYVDRLVGEFKDKICEVGADKIAAFIVEPVSGATLGSVPPLPGYLAKMQKVCAANGILLIADEVMCGVGRTGTMFAQEQDNICADIITIAKGLGAGYQPISAVLSSEKVISAIEENSGRLANGHTYMSHAIACAGAGAVLDVIEQDHLLDTVVDRGNYLSQQLQSRFGQHPNIGDIRGRGLFWTLELVAERPTKHPFDPTLGLATRIQQQALSEGLICYPSSGCIDGVMGDHVLLAPPYISTESHIDEICDKLASVLDTCLGNLKGTS